MKQEVSVDDAVKQGKIKLVFIPASIIIGCIILGTFLITANCIEGWMFVFFLFGSVLIAWLYWSYSVTHWRIWAFENVRNVHHLKAKAIRHKLIWDEGIFLTKTEIRNHSQQHKLEQIQKKFLQKDVFRDDPNVPKEVSVYYSKAGNFAGILVGILAICFSIFFYQSEKNLLFVFGFAGIGIYFLYLAYKKLVFRGPLLVLSADGIRFKDANLISWLPENREEFRIEGSGKNAVSYFTVYHDGRSTEIALNDVGISIDQLEKYAQIYRMRYEKNHA